MEVDNNEGNDENGDLIISMFNQMNDEIFELENFNLELHEWIHREILFDIIINEKHISNSKLLIDAFLKSYTIPENFILYINGTFFFIRENTNKIKALFSFPDGYLSYNQKNKFPFLTSSIQICLCQNFKGTNAVYNNLLQKQIKYQTQIDGDSLNKPFTISANYSPYSEEAIIETTYMIIEANKILTSYPAFVRKGDCLFGENMKNHYIFPEIRKTTKKILDENLLNFKTSLYNKNGELFL